MILCDIIISLNPLLIMHDYIKHKGGISYEFD
jgi:hypothetical protein